MVLIKVSSVEIIYSFDSLFGFLMRISRNESQIKHNRIRAVLSIAMTFSVMNKPRSDTRQFRSTMQIKRTDIFTSSSVMLLSDGVHLSKNIFTNFCLITGSLDVNISK